MPVSLVKGDAGKKGADMIIAAAQRLEAVTGQPVGKITIDTLARATAGDNEDATDAMMSFVEQRLGYIGRAGPRSRSS